jgi:hypothetical protein
MINSEFVYSYTSCLTNRPSLRATASSFLLLVAWGCGIKTQVKVSVSPKIAAAKSATVQELLGLLDDYRNRVTSLSSTSMRVDLTVGTAEGGTVQKYHSAPAYILLRRPDEIHLNILAPVTKTTILELLSRGDQFEVWVPRDNKVYTGRNSARGFELEENGEALVFTARPVHILEAILPRPLMLHQPDLRISGTEEEDARAKYYVLTLLRETGGVEIQTLRRLKIERSEMAVVEDETFTEAGGVASIVDYSDLARFDGVVLPREIRIERPGDGYSLDLHFKDWRVNPNLDDAAFVLNPPPAAERVILKEKVKGDS